MRTTTVIRNITVQIMRRMLAIFRASYSTMKLHRDISDTVIRTIKIAS